MFKILNVNNLCEIIVVGELLSQVLLVEKYQQRHAKIFAQNEDQQRHKLYKILVVVELLSQVLLVEKIPTTARIFYQVTVLVVELDLLLEEVHHGLQ